MLEIKPESDTCKQAPYEFYYLLASKLKKKCCATLSNAQVSFQALHSGINPDKA